MVEQPQALPFATEYDTRGRKTKRTFYNHDGSPHSTDLFVYDTKGALIKWAKFDSGGSPVSETTYTRDSESQRVGESSYGGGGTLLEKRVHLYEKKDDREVQVTYDGDGRLRTKSVEFFDDKGREREVLIYHGLPKSAAGGGVREDARGAAQAEAEYAGKIVFAYDDEKNSTVISVYKGDGSLDGRQETVRDGMGNVTESADYAANGELRSKETYTREFDHAGNWTKQLKFKLDIKSGKLKPVEATYREITYY